MEGPTDIRDDLKALAAMMDNDPPMSIKAGGMVACPVCGHLWVFGPNRENTKPCEHLKEAFSEQA